MQAMLTDIEDRSLPGIISGDVVYSVATGTIYVDADLLSRWGEIFGSYRVRNRIRWMERDFRKYIKAGEYHKIPLNLGCYVLGQLRGYEDLSMLWFRSRSPGEAMSKPVMVTANGRPRKDKKPKAAKSA